MVLEKDAKKKFDRKKNKWKHLNDGGGKAIVDEHPKKKEMILTKT